MNKKTKKLLNNPLTVIASLGHRGWFNWMDDAKYLKMIYRIKMKESLDLEHPQTYNQKLQWLKLYDRKPVYTQMVDKCEAKKYAASIIGQEHIIPTLGVWERFEDIDFDKLPNQFVLKCTHDSGGLVICKDKSKLNKEKARKLISSCLKHNYYWGLREWPYKNVKPRIIAEQYMEDESGELKDYKFFCFDGEAKAMFIATDRSNPKEETKFDFYDMDFNHLPFTNGHPNATKTIEKPRGFEEMKNLAAKLSKGIPHVRVDLYDINGHIYFGEMTFSHWSGLVPFVPAEWDTTFGSWIKLPKTKVGGADLS